MSKQLVARALRALAIDGEESTAVQRAIDDSIANLIRAVDAQYGERYDEAGGFGAMYSVRKIPQYYWCIDCFGERGAGHKPDCDRWNTRVALLTLCRDITGEKG